MIPPYPHDILKRKIAKKAVRLRRLYAYSQSAERRLTQLHERYARALDLAIHEAEERLRGDGLDLVRMVEEALLKGAKNG